MKSSQAYVMLGRLVPADPDFDARAPALSALAAVMSRRMGDLLREKRGLSYSLGAESARLGDSSQLTISMGVLPANVEQARSGIREVLAGLVSGPPDQQEIDDAVRSTRIRMVMRGLSRINRAYSRCMEELRGRPGETKGTGTAGAVVTTVTPQQVRGEIRRLLGEPLLLGWTEAVVGGAPEETKSEPETPRRKG
jgi:predicted Zn-dependent peptidase